MNPAFECEGNGAASRLHCITPNLIVAGGPPSGGRAVALVAINGQQYTEPGVQFTYLGASTVNSLSPPRGVMEGGTPVTVYGSGFSSSVAEAVAGAELVSGSATFAVMPSTSCRFNESVVPATYRGNAGSGGKVTILCYSPHSAAGYLTVEVSTNGRDYTTDGVQYEAVAVVLTGVTPWSGPELGGTAVTISGARMHSASDLQMQCRFGWMPSYGLPFSGECLRHPPSLSEAHAQSLPRVQQMNIN